jgi:hypothetical protein
MMETLLPPFSMSALCTIYFFNHSATLPPAHLQPDSEPEA